MFFLKSKISICILLSLFLTSCHAEDVQGVSKSKALEIAKNELVETYGKKVLNQQPFIATENDTSWKFKGTFHCPPGNVCKGGVAIIEISKKDGSVIKKTHEK